MTDEEIIQVLRICATHIEKGCGLCPQMKYVRCTERLADEAITMIERLTAENAALREKQRWIPVTERLPDERDAVIILLKDGQVFRGEIRERIALPEWWYFYDASDTDMDMLGVMYPLFNDELWLHENPVVAWMPLPEATEGNNAT
jgi:hypothetical protein|nr:MAG TPA: Protein of unknown function (DUF551) [Caudoviricetes sp.]